MSWSFQWSLSFWLTHQYHICIHLRPIRATCPAHIDLYICEKIWALETLIWTCVIESDLSKY
jgi:hypothetical protein